MSLQKPIYTLNYAQPDEYHFSHDSVLLARKVFDMIEIDLSHKDVLDLCSGCGIIGLDFLFHCKIANRRIPRKVDFLEVQKVYRSYFEENLFRFGEGLSPVHFINENYEILKTDIYKEAYDYIFSNPPYFREGHGLLSASEFKNRCRFFIDSDFKNFIESILYSLKFEGIAYILLRDLNVHGIDAFKEAQVIIGDQGRASVVGDIRGTLLVMIEKY